jgi:hypothetical protein
VRYAAALALAGVIAVAIGFAADPTQAAFAYLTAWAFAISIALGALIFIMIGHAMSAKWTRLFQRQGELVVGALPILAVLFVPVVVWSPHIYPWLQAASHDPEAAMRAAHRAAWLDEPFWIVRAVCYLGFWVYVGERMRRRPTTVFACAMFVPLGVTLTFAAFDWLMSLEPDWISTVYGLIYFAGGFVGACALVAAITRATAEATGALARLIFGFLIFWLYVEFAQGFIIWIANKPDEVPWYVTRAAGGWGALLVLLFLGGFVVPFFSLLPRDLSRDPRWVGAVGAWLVVLHYLDIYWLVMPVLHPLPAVHWLDVAAPAAVLGIAAVVALLRRPPSFADDDPRVIAAREYRGNDI